MAEIETTPKEYEVFKDAIREENLEIQIKMTRELKSLASLLGAEQTRNELLPFIKENLDFHDEILLNLSEQLNGFVPLVGGYEHSQPILDLLRKLCNTDETIVRAKTVETLKDMAENMNSELTEELLVPMLEGLSNEDWFTSKCSAVALYPTIYSKVREEKKTELRHSFRLIIQDESPIVRKEAARSLVEMIPTIEKEVLKDEFIPVLDNIFDDMDSVRVNAVPISIALSRRLTENEIEEHVLKVITSCAEDPSWKMRQVLAHSIAELQEAIPHGKMRGKILFIYQEFVKDFEPSVRIAAAENLANYCRSLKKSYETQPENNFDPVFKQSIVPQIILLSEDRNDDVRTALSRNILNLGSVLTESCFKQTILPIVIDFLERDQSMLVQANLLQNLDSLPENIDITKYLSSIKEVASFLIKNSHAHWRTRMSLLAAFLHITKFANKKYFSENLTISYVTLLEDPVFAVRRTAPIILPLLAKQYGIEWAAMHLIPYLKMFTKNSRYLYRYTPLFGILELVYPSVRMGRKDTYLKDLKCFCSSENGNLKRFAARRLLRVRKMTMELKQKFEKETYKNVLALNRSIDDFKSDDISLYSGDYLKIFEKNPNSSIFSIDENEVIEKEPTYLEGLLLLIHTEFLEVILDLFDDAIVNIQIRSIYLLNRIKQFTDSLSTELEEPWIPDALQIFNNEEIEVVEKDVEAEITKTRIETGKEEINTDLMEDISVDADKKTELDIDFIDDNSILVEPKIPNITVEEVVEEEPMLVEIKSDDVVSPLPVTQTLPETELETIISSTVEVPREE
nr:serine/threonine-protein phosphatase PP2A 65 kDa regulatory subunit-like [Leptinotarsa decemlineata]